MRWARLIGITCLGVGAMVVAAHFLTPPRLHSVKPNGDASVAKESVKKSE